MYYNGKQDKSIKNSKALFKRVKILNVSDSAISIVRKKKIFVK